MCSRKLCALGVCADCINWHGDKDSRVAKIALESRNACARHPAAASSYYLACPPANKSSLLVESFVVRVVLT